MSLPLVILLICCQPWVANTAPIFPRNAFTAEPSSTVLEMHRYYLEHPPHDCFLYNVLNVSPNATAAEISKSYRRLSRKYHPDKHGQNSAVRNDDHLFTSPPENALRRIREAYEILKEDETRLIYHRYGVINPAEALFLLTGKGSSTYNNQDMEELLQLIGLLPNDVTDRSIYGNQLDHQNKPKRQHRLKILTADLTEKLRPYVEGSVGLHDLVDAVIADCDKLKRLPLGAQILRCVGRAYRSVGREFLHQSRSTGSVHVIQHHVTEKWRRMKHMAHATFLGGRVVWAERTYDHTESPLPSSKEEPLAALTYDTPSALFEDDWGQDGPSDEDIRREQKRKANQAKLLSLQLEALWKVSKIDLDRIVRKACKCILQDESCFLLHNEDNEFRYEKLSQSTEHNYGNYRPPPPTPSVDGFVRVPPPPSRPWAGKNSAAKLVHTVSKEQASLRAAEALAIMGETMVQRSKEGTAWMD